MSEFAKRLVTERERLGLTPTAFGSKAGVGVRLQAQFEAARLPPLPYLLRLDEMGVDVLYLLTGRRCNSLSELSSVSSSCLRTIALAMIVRSSTFWMR